MVKILYMILFITIIYSQDNQIFKIAINNDRDEVFDILNIVYQISDTIKKDSLNNCNISTKIKDENDNVICSYENIIPSSFLFTVSKNITNLEKIKDNNFYQIEVILECNIDNIESIANYTFKKIEKINRKVRFDEYGRMYLNDELFFSFWFFYSKCIKIL